MFVMYTLYTLYMAVSNKLPPTSYIKLIYIWLIFVLIWHRFTTRSSITILLPSFCMKKDIDLVIMLTVNVFN